MRTVLEVLNLSSEYLEKRGIAHSRRQAEELLSEALKMGRMALYMQHDRPVTEEELERCRTWLKRRGQGEPLQYISGSVQFFDCEFRITPDVLIPRQETEILVDNIVKDLKTRSLANKVLWDVCCGSGCMGIAIKKRLPDLEVVLSDIWQPAVDVAAQNAALNEVNVELLQGDLLAPFTGRKADYIVCNPPYIAESEYAGLDIEVRDFEPKRALISGEKGLEFYERLAEDLPQFLNPGAKIWFEIGKGQGEGVKRAFQGGHWRAQKVECDWAGHERFFSLEIE